MSQCMGYMFLYPGTIAIIYQQHRMSIGTVVPYTAVVTIATEIDAITARTTFVRDHHGINGFLRTVLR